MKYKTSNDYFFNCGECKTEGSVKAIETFNKRSRIRTIAVKKCTNCKKQYGIKSVSELDRPEIKKPLIA